MKPVYAALLVCTGGHETNNVQLETLENGHRRPDFPVVRVGCLHASCPWAAWLASHPEPVRPEPEAVGKKLLDVPYSEGMAFSYCKAECRKRYEGRCCSVSWGVYGLLDKLPPQSPLQHELTRLWRWADVYAAVYWNDKRQNAIWSQQEQRWKPWWDVFRDTWGI